MFKLVLILDDATVVAVRGEDGIWEGASIDSGPGASARSHYFYLQDVQLAALVAIAIDGESNSAGTPGSRMRNSAYDIVNEFISDWPLECRPIP